MSRTFKDKPAEHMPLRHSWRHEDRIRVARAKRELERLRLEELLSLWQEPDVQLSWYFDWNAQAICAPAEPPTPVAIRKLNAWLEGAEHLAVGVPAQLYVQFTASETEPDWGGQEVLHLLFCLSHGEFEVSIYPSSRRADLAKFDEMEPIAFELVARQTGTVTLTLMIFLARELALLQEYEFTLPEILPAETSAPCVLIGA